MNKSKNIFILGSILLIICIIIAVSVTIANTITDPIIIKSEENTKKIFFEKIFPKAKNFKNITNSIQNKNSTIDEIYQVFEKNNINTIGYIYIISTKGYADKIKNLIAIDSKNNKIKSINILYQNETPGLGDKITKNKFTDQYIGIDTNKTIIVTKKTNNIKLAEIQAITSSTITSKAVTLGVNNALYNYTNFFKKGANN